MLFYMQRNTLVVLEIHSIMEHSDEVYVGITFAYKFFIIAIYNLVTTKNFFD